MERRRERRRDRNEQAVAGPERQAELNVERGEAVPEDARLRQAQQRAARQQRVAGPAGRVAIQGAGQDEARQRQAGRAQRAARLLGQAATAQETEQP